MFSGWVYCGYRLMAWSAEYVLCLCVSISSSSVSSTWLYIELGSDVVRFMWQHSTGGWLLLLMYVVNCHPTVSLNTFSSPSSSPQLWSSSSEPKSEHSDGVKLLRLDRDANSLTESLSELILSLSWVSCSRNFARFSLICISCSSTLFTKSALFMFLVKSEWPLPDDALLRVPLFFEA